jgi:glycosyltransferase involved in cell wall biosynthesis
MKIAVDIRSLLDGRRSGIERYTTSLIAGFLRVAPQHEYHLFYNSVRVAHVHESHPALHLHAFHYPNKVFNAVQWATARPRWNQLVEADVFFMPSFRLLPVAPEVPVVTTVHDLSYEHFPEFFSWRRRLWHRAMRPRTALTNSDHLIAVSQATARDLMDTYHIPPQRISVVYSGIDMPAAISDGRQVSQRYRLPEAFILFTATLEPRKNVPSVIRAFSAIAHQIPHHLVIAGLPGWLTREITRETARSRWQERIHFPGFIAEEDLPAVYAAATLFVYPSFYEGFGFPPLEALIAGTPVITAYNAALPEVVGDWATLVNPYDPGELAAVMHELVQHKRRVPPELRQQLRRDYSWDTTARATLNVIEDVA